jgi:hypothetical protein
MYVILRVCLYDTIVLNVHTPTEDKIDDTKDRFYEKLEREFDKYHMNNLLGDFNAKVGREDTSKPTIGNESWHRISVIMEFFFFCCFLRSHFICNL